VPANVTATVTELPESRVRVEAEVDPAEVERRVQGAARALGRDVRVPGFRKGKVPAPVIIRRVGRAAVLDEAVRESLGSWYAAAIAAAGIAPVGDPELDVSGLPEENEPLRFSIEIGVRPRATLGQYRELEVGRREPQASEDEVEAEIERQRERLARLESVERAAEQGDFVVLDFVGSIDDEPFAGGEARDQLLELGSGRLVEGFEDQLVGAAAGEQRTVEVTFPQDYRAQELAGRQARFAVSVKDVKAKELPPLDDELASDAAGLDTLAELREDIAGRLQEAQRTAIEREFREVALDAAVAEADVDVPEALVQARSRELWEQMTHTLEHQGIGKEVYLQISGKTEEQVLAEAAPEAAQALRREAVLAAIAAAEEIEPGEDELLEALRPAAERDQVKPEKLLARLREGGRLEALREDLAHRRALDLLAESAVAITVEQAQAREKLWTPESESGSTAAPELWTPGS